MQTTKVTKKLWRNMSSLWRSISLFISATIYLLLGDTRKVAAVIVCYEAVLNVYIVGARVLQYVLVKGDALLLLLLG